MNAPPSVVSISQFHLPHQSQPSIHSLSPDFGGILSRALRRAASLDKLGIFGLLRAFDAGLASEWLAMSPSTSSGRARAEHREARVEWLPGPNVNTNQN